MAHSIRPSAVGSLERAIMSQYDKELFVDKSTEEQLNTFIFETMLHITSIKTCGDIIKRMVNTETLVDLHPEFPHWIDRIIADATAIIELRDALRTATREEHRQ
jgi:hypothetical protein